jgi:hypothetical protein
MVTIAIARSEQHHSVIETVASILPHDPRCPYCSGERRPNGRRVVRFRDVPVARVPRFVDWRRQQYRCTACARASNEEHPAFEKDRFCTRRFTQWVLRKSATTTFVKTAKQAGMNHLVLRRLFHAVTADPAPSPAQPKVLAIALVTLAGRPRPLLADAASNCIIDILASTDELMTHLAPMGRSTAHGIACVIRDVELDTPALLSDARLARLLPGLRASGIDSRSLARLGLELLVAQYDGWIKAVAMLQDRSRAAVRKDVGRAYDVKAIAIEMKSRWIDNEHASPLSEVERQTEWFAGHWRNQFFPDRRQAGLSPEQTWPEPDFKAVAKFIVSGFRDVIQHHDGVDLVRTEQWLDTLRNHQIKRSHSFVAARIALLDRYGDARKPGSTDAIALTSDRLTVR